MEQKEKDISDTVFAMTFGVEVKRRAEARADAEEMIYKAWTGLIASGMKCDRAYEVMLTALNHEWQSYRWSTMRLLTEGEI